MHIEKAIEILEDLMTTAPQFDPDDRRDAVELGIEALKRIESCRVGDAANVELPLSGEGGGRVK
ncbi:hypothetical protein ES705_35466 [subsurface metagenome]